MTDKEDGPRFDPNGPDLVYVLIADDIATQIQDGRLVPGQRLPAEHELAAEYGAARMTVRGRCANFGSAASCGP
ncbi:MAG: winged helix-turn-helix domain-containing protein [Streptosporangiales bacterium]